MRNTLIVAAFALGALVPAFGVSGATASDVAVTVLDLELNEPAGATVAHDTHDPLGLVRYDGAIGSHVTMRSEADPSSPDGTGVTKFADFDRHAPKEGIDYDLEHLIVVPDAADGSLDPGPGDFTIEMRFRTKDSFGNVLQKGQAKAAGGQVKIQMPGGRVQCLFNTPQGKAAAGTGTANGVNYTFNDNQWHILRCERTSRSVTLYIDGIRYGKVNHFTGNLDNKKPWTLGGKPECDAITVTCDYYPGTIDYVRLYKG